MRNSALGPVGAFVAMVGLTAGLCGAGGMTDPPQGPVECPPEYAPTQGILIAWEQFQSTLALIAAHITTTGNADVYVICDTPAEVTSARTAIDNVASPNANMNRVFTFVVPTDTVWIRDYGPRYIFEGSVRAIVDHTYNLPRPNDDAFPMFWATNRNLARYEIPLVHSGGNHQVSGIAVARATDLVLNENPGLMLLDIHDLWMNFLNVDTAIDPAFPAHIDATQNIDMWMQFCGDQKAVISQWATSPPLNPGDPDPRVICNNAASSLQMAGWTIHRTPAFFNAATSVHYTFTSVLICNDLVIVPSYTNTIVSGSNAAALATWQAALPGKTFVQIHAEPLVAFAGGIHRITSHVPSPIGGTSPTVFLRTLRGPEELEPGSEVDIRWSADDDVAVTSIAIHFSTDGGATFPTVIAASTPNDGLFTWTVPSTDTDQGRIRVTARDAQGNTGTDASVGDLTIDVPPAPTPPGAFTLTSPADAAADVPLEPTMEWDAASGAESYTLLIDTEMDFTPPAVFEVMTAATSVDIPAGVLVEETLYFWRVEATNVNGSTAGTPDPASFTTVPPVPGAFMLISPTDGEMDVPVDPTMEWESATDAMSYTLTISAESDLDPAILETTIGATSLMVPGGVLANSTQYYWRVTANNAVGSTPGTPDPSSFTTIPPLPGAFMLVSPADGATGVLLEPDLSWDASSDATSYALTIDDDVDFSSPVLEETPSMTFFAVPDGVLVNDIQYYWRVVASNVAGSTAGTPDPSLFTTISNPGPLCVGDADRDGLVGFEDIIMTLAHWGDQSEPFSPGDANGDGIVNFADITTTLANWGFPCR